jgi:8-oxo-dGTP diphosphatase
MIRYSAGFLFSKDYKQVLLIKKEKPDWQRGLYNGVGGKVEPGETELNCMIREFEEETKLAS